KEVELKELMQKYPNCNKKGIGKLPEEFANEICCKEPTKPFYAKPRMVPYARREQAEKALQDWVDQGILKPVMHAEWAHPVVYREKSDKTVRICADFKAGLNRQVPSRTI